MFIYLFFRYVLLFKSKNNPVKGSQGSLEEMKPQYFWFADLCIELQAQEQRGIYGVVGIPVQIRGLRFLLLQ